MALRSISSGRAADSGGARTDRALIARRVTKVFPASRGGAHAAPGPVLAEVTFSVGIGETVAVMGPNGAGKTTLLEIVAGLVAPTSGSVEVDGRDVTRRPGASRAAIGYSGAAGHGFYGRLTAERNLELFAVLSDVARRDARRRARALAERLGIAHALASAVETFSDGMRQRLALARALMADPTLLLLDEPSRSVDPAFRQALHRLLREWREAEARRAIVIVTHDPDEARALADRVLVLEAGRLAGVWPGAAAPALGMAPPTHLQPASGA